MGANSQFDKMLPAIEPEAGNIKEPRRQVEIFTYGGDLFLRVGPINEENIGTNRYTVKISREDGQALIYGIENGINYLGL